MRYKEDTLVLDAASSFAKAAMTINPVEMLVPTNLAAVSQSWKAAAITGEFMNPVFRYNEPELTRIKLLLSKIMDNYHVIESNCQPENKIDIAIMKILELRYQDALLAAEIASDILSERDSYSQEALFGLYGTPSADLIKQSFDAIEHPERRQEDKGSRFSEEKRLELKNRRFNAEQIRKIFLKVLVYYDFIGSWNCVIDPNITNAIDARDKTKSGQSLLVIPATKIVDGVALANLIGHEIESHIRGSENSRSIFKELLAGTPLLPLVRLLAKSDNEVFYEGVAKMRDVETNGDASLPHPYYVIAASLAREGYDFRYVANTVYAFKLSAGASKKEAIDFAWNIARRIFRGCTNTKCGFANTKDIGYFMGYQIAKETRAILRNYSSMTLDDINLLEAAGVDFSNVAHPYKDAVSFIFE